MSENTQRDVFFQRLYEIARTDKNVVVVTADMSAPALDRYRIELPNQFVNVGIAEQNAILIASGLSIVGKKVYAYAISPFITLRCLEQIRVSNAIMEIPIVIVGMGTGLSYCNDGPTHHLLEDIAIMRALPNVQIINITDNVMAGAYADISYDSRKTQYIRIDKDVYPDIYSKNYDFSLGVAHVEKGTENLLLTSGPMTHILAKIVRRIKKKNNNLDIGVVDVHKFPVNEDIFIQIVRDTKKILTVEEHFLPGGLGSAVLECLNNYAIHIPMKRMGLDPSIGYKNCYQYGGREIIRKHYGIDQDSIEKEIMEFFKI